MCILIGLQVCFDSAMKHENDVSDSKLREFKVSWKKLNTHMPFKYRFSFCLRRIIIIL